MRYPLTFIIEDGERALDIAGGSERVCTTKKTRRPWNMKSLVVLADEITILHLTVLDENEEELMEIDLNLPIPTAAIGRELPMPEWHLGENYALRLTIFNELPQYRKIGLYFIGELQG